jgi:hypothetical protein
LSLRILIANVTLGSRTGTEIVTRDLACGLAARGHRVSVFTPETGPLADEIARAGVRVVTALRELDEPPDVVQGHHFLETAEALTYFPQARGIFVCHDRTAAHSIPPRTSRVNRYVAVDENCAVRLRDDWHVPPRQIRVILNAVDTRRFLPRSPLPPRPTRALVFSNYATPGTHVETVQAACAQLGLPVDVLGAGTEAASAAPERHLGKYDLVFAKARCALESLAVGCAVVLCDAAGSGPMVTSAELPGLRAWNFGQQLLRQPLSPVTLLDQMGRYDPADAAAVSRAIREQADLDSALVQYEELYREVLTEPAAADDVLRSVVQPLLTRTVLLERELAAYRRTERMLPLSDDDVSHLHLTAERVPATMVAGATVFGRVRIQNDLGAASIGTWPPFPVHLVYRWRPADSPTFLAMEVPRSLLHRPVGPRAAEGFAVRIKAPSAPGRYLLRITLVQEGWRWLDTAPTPPFADTPVNVTRPTLLTDIGR